MPSLSIVDAMGTDIAHVGDFIPTAGGDLQTVSGLANLVRALFHRLVTVPGSLVHRPTYGVGIGLYQNGINSFAIQQKIADVIREQFIQDPRVQSVNSVAIVNNDTDPNQTIIRVFVVPVGYTEKQMDFTPFALQVA